MPSSFRRPLLHEALWKSHDCRVTSKWKSKPLLFWRSSDGSCRAMLFTSHHMTIRMLLLSAVIVFSIKAYAQHRVRSLLVSPDRIEHQFLPSLQLDSLSGDTV